MLLSEEIEAFAPFNEPQPEHIRLTRWAARVRELEQVYAAAVAWHDTWGLTDPRRIGAAKVVRDLYGAVHDASREVAPELSEGA